MLEKYFGWLTGTGLLLFFSIVSFPQNFQVVVNWFGPMLGQNLMPVLMLSYILFAPATKYFPILMAHIVSGFVCGAVGRGGIKRSILLAFLVFLTLFLFIGANIYPMIIRVFSSSESLRLPNLPPGASISDLLSLPLVSDYLPSILENLFSGASGGMGFGLGGLFGNVGTVTQLIINLIINPVIFCVSSVVGGLTVSKILPRFRKKKVFASPSNLSIKILALSVVCLVLFEVPLASCDTPKKFDSAFKGSLATQDLGEDLGGVLEMLKGDFIWTIIQNDGSLSLICGYGSSNPADMGVSLSADDLQGIMFAGFLVRGGELTLPEGIPQDLQQFLPLIPNQGFIVLSTNSESETQIQTVVSKFETALGIHFKKVTALQIPTENLVLNVMFYDVSEGMTIEEGYLKFRSMLPGNGVLSLVSPDKVVSKPFVALVGIINLETLGGFGLKIDDEDGLIALAINYAEWSKNFFTGTQTFTFSLQEILGFTGQISSNLPNGSYIVVSIPETVNATNLSVNPIEAEVYGNTIILKVNPREVYTDLQIGFVARFPPNIVITKTVSPSITNADGTVTVTVTIKNLGDITVNNVNLNDSRTIASYPLTALIVSGQTSGSWAKLEPNETKTISYVVKVTSNGVYTLTPASATYSTDLGEQRKESEKCVIISEFNFGKYLSELFVDETFVINPFILIFSLAVIIPPVVEAIKIALRKLRKKPSTPSPATIGDTEQTV